MHTHRQLRAARVFIPTLVLLGLLALASSFTPIAQAASIVVDDAGDALHSPGCADDGTTSPCTLRDAITFANANGGADTITFQIPMMAGCTSANVCTITLGSPLPDITNHLTIDGSQNAADITISGDNTYRVMIVDTGTTLTLDTLTIANGRSDSDYGGGIYNFQGTLNIANSTFRGNSAPNAGGGAIMNQFATLNIVNSTFSGNTAGLGGGIFNFQGTTNIANYICSAVCGFRSGTSLTFKERRTLPTAPLAAIPQPTAAAAPSLRAA